MLLVAKKQTGVVNLTRRICHKTKRNIDAWEFCQHFLHKVVFRFRGPEGGGYFFRNWYVDGRLYYLKVIDVKKPQDGIQEIRYIDPMKMKYVRQQKKDKKNRKQINCI